MIGDPNFFDISSLTFASFHSGTNRSTVEILFNCGGGISFNQFSVGGAFNALNVGDLLFSNGGFHYAVQLRSRGGFTAGNLYQIAGTRTAKQVLGLGSEEESNYRPNQAVWANTTGETWIGRGTSTAVSTGGPTNRKVTLDFAANDVFLAGFDNSSFAFSAATCGNDVITGSVPEPGTWALLGAGLIGSP